MKLWLRHCVSRQINGSCSVMLVGMYANGIYVTLLPQSILMNWHRAFLKALILATVGFLTPIVLLLPVELSLSEFMTQQDWTLLLQINLPLAIGCSLLFLASAITSSTPRRIVTFVQSLFLHGVTLIISFLAFVPIRHTKEDNPDSSYLIWVPLVAVLLMFLLLIVLGNISTNKLGQESKTVADSIPRKYDA